MTKGSFLPLTVGLVGVSMLLLNLMGDSTPIARLAMGLIVFSITLAIVSNRSDDPKAGR
ncbi:MAG: hypothetical protein ACTHWA_11500 [Arachnia sp.]